MAELVNAPVKGKGLKTGMATAILRISHSWRRSVVLRVQVLLHVRKKEFFNIEWYILDCGRKDALGLSGHGPAMATI